MTPCNTETSYLRSLPSWCHDWPVVHAAALAISAFVDETQNVVTGTVRMKLYKGTAWPVASKSPYSLYNEEFATFSADEVYDQSDAEGFINLFSLPLKIRAIQKQNLEGIPEAQKALPKKIFKGGSFVE